MVTGSCYTVSCFVIISTNLNPDMNSKKNASVNVFMEEYERKCQKVPSNHISEVS